MKNNLLMIRGVSFQFIKYKDDVFVHVHDETVDLKIPVLYVIQNAGFDRKRTEHS